MSLSWYVLFFNSIFLIIILSLLLKGYLIDGTEFDSSYKRKKPTTFAPNQVIKGWTEAMQVFNFDFNLIFMIFYLIVLFFS